MKNNCQVEREEMVSSQLEKRGIREARVLEAFRGVPRHEFVPGHLKGRAYADGPLPLDQGQAISQPYMVAIMTQAARLSPGQRVLEIGTGSGYQSAILAEMGMEVYTIERMAVLSKQAKRTLQRLGYHGVRAKVGDGTLGWKDEAPFDAVLVTAAAPELPAPLLDQLELGGRLVIPLEEGPSQVLYVITRRQSDFHRNRGERCTFVPLIGEYGWEKDPRP